MKRILSTLFALAFCLVLLPASASAAEQTVTYLQADGTETTADCRVLSSSSATVDCFEGVYYVPDGTTIDDGLCSSNGDVTLVLGGDVTIGWIEALGGNLTITRAANATDAKLTVSRNTDGYGACFAIFADNDVTICAGTVEAKDTGYGRNSFYGFAGSIGVFVKGTLTVSGNATLTATGRSLDADVYTDVSNKGYSWDGYLAGSIGILTKGGVVVKDSATVTATGSDIKDLPDNVAVNSYGIYATSGNISVSGNAKLTATGGDIGSSSTNDGSSAGIYAYNGSVTVGSSARDEQVKLTATGGDLGKKVRGNSYGIYANGNVTVDVDVYNRDPAIVTAIGGDTSAANRNATSGDSAGIYATGSVSIANAASDDGKAAVNVTGGNAKKVSYGIYAATSVSLSDGNIAVKSGSAGSASDSGKVCSYGSYSKNVTVGGGSNAALATVTGGDATTGNDEAWSVGIYATETLKIARPAQLTASAGAATAGKTAVSHGVYCKYLVGTGGVANFPTKLTANGGEVSGGETGGCFANGVYATESVADCFQLEATGGTVTGGTAKTGDISGVYTQKLICGDGGYGEANNATYILTGGTDETENNAVTSYGAYVVGTEGVELLADPTGGNFTALEFTAGKTGNADLYIPNAGLTVQGRGARFCSTIDPITFESTPASVYLNGTLSVSNLEAEDCCLIKFVEGSTVSGDVKADYLATGCAYASGGNEVARTALDSSTAYTVKRCDHKDASGNSAFTANSCAYCDANCNSGHSYENSWDGCAVCGTTCDHSFGDGYTCTKCDTYFPVQMKVYDTANDYKTYYCYATSIKALLDYAAANSSLEVNSITLDPNMKNHEGYSSGLTESALTFNCVANYTLDLSGNTLASDLTFAAGNGYVTIVNGTVDGSILVQKGRVGLGVENDASKAVTVTGNLTYGDKDLTDRGEVNGTLYVGTKIAGTLSTEYANAANSSYAKYLYNLLDPDAATNSCKLALKDSSGSFVNGYKNTSTANVTVVAHDKHEGTESGCACGLECTHTTCDANTGICDRCNYQLPVKAVACDSNGTALETAWKLTIKDALTAVDGQIGTSSYEVTLKGDQTHWYGDSEDWVITGTPPIKLDLAGCAFGGNIYVDGGSLTIVNSDATVGYLEGELTYETGTLKLGTGVAVMYLRNSSSNSELALRSILIPGAVAKSGGAPVDKVQNSLSDIITEAHTGHSFTAPSVGTANGYSYLSHSCTVCYLECDHASYDASGKCTCGYQLPVMMTAAEKTVYATTFSQAVYRLEQAGVNTGATFTFTPSFTVKLLGDIGDDTTTATLSDTLGGGFWTIDLNGSTYYGDLMVSTDKQARIRIEDTTNVGGIAGTFKVAGTGVNFGLKSDLEYYLYAGTYGAVVDERNATRDDNVSDMVDSDNGYWFFDASGNIIKGSAAKVKELTNVTVKQCDHTYKDGVCTVCGAVQCTVTFDLNGGTGTIDAQKVLKDQKATAPTTPTREGYAFGGWYTAATGGTAFDFSTAITENITLYARWTANTYTVSYAAGQYGEGTISAGTKTHGVDFTLESSTFTRTGYTQTGWATTDGGDKAYDLGGSYTADASVTFYPVWTQNSSGGSAPSYTGGSSSTYAVTVSTVENGTVTVSPKNASKGTTVTITVTPDAGYTLETLTVTDKNGNALELTDKGNGKYSFKMPAGKVTVNATFMDDNTMLNFFVDVPADKYYYDAVLWAAKNGITGGIDETHFGPDLSCTRAQIVTFLWKIAGQPVVNYAMDFSDVSENAYYAEAVRWAASQGIVSGYGNGLFGSDDAITREQMAVILYHFAQSMGMDTTQGGMAVREFADYESISGYAISAMQWAVNAGVMAGYDGHLMPTQPCTRAQIVTMLYNLLGK